MTLEKLTKMRSMQSDQLDCEIEGTDTIYLAQYFDNVEYYLGPLGLTPAEQTDVKKEYVINGTQIAINHCLCLWRRHNPSTATVRTLLEILLKLGKEEIASEVCDHYCLKLNKKSKSNSTA